MLDWYIYISYIYLCLKCCMILLWHNIFVPKSKCITKYKKKKAVFLKEIIHENMLSGFCSALLLTNCGKLVIVLITIVNTQSRPLSRQLLCNELCWNWPTYDWNPASQSTEDFCIVTDEKIKLPTFKLNHLVFSQLFLQF